MIERYYKAYESIKSAEKCIIIGFGFRRDDSHILNILKRAIEENKDIEFCVIAGKNEKDRIRSIPKIGEKLVEKFQPYDELKTSEEFMEVLKKWCG